MYYWRKINIILFATLLVFLIPAIISLVQPGFIETDDATWMVIRFTAFFDSLRDGQIPVRLLERLNNGYGYPVANFLYPGFMYIASAIHIFGVGFVDSIKLLLIFSMFFSGIFTYLWLKKLFDPHAAFIGSLFYVYTPYHLFDLYTRGSVGEVLAFTFLPFILWQIDRRSIHFVAFGIFSLILSHNSLAFLFLPLIFLYAICTKNTLIMIFGSLLGIAMSAFFIIPALFELSYTKFADTVISNPFEYFASVELVGYSTILALVVCLITLFFIRRTLRFVAHKALLTMFIITCLVSILLSTQISMPLWDFIPSQFIQFPFRILSLLVVGISFIAAFSISKTSGKMRIGLLILLILALGYSAMPYLKPIGRSFFPDEYYSTNVDTTTVKDEYMPKWVKNKSIKAPEKRIEVLSGNAQAEIITLNSRKIELDLKNSANSVVRINYIYYPGWKAYMNYEKMEISYDNEFGVMDIYVKRGAGILTLVFDETPLRFASDTVSVIALLLGLGLLLSPILKFK